MIGPLKRWLRSRREARWRALEKQLGPYTMYGSGPFGAWSAAHGKQQLEVARLRQRLGLKQETNWVVGIALRLNGIKSD
jgi:hypothetical protein